MGKTQNTEHSDDFLHFQTKHGLQMSPPLVLIFPIFRKQHVDVILGEYSKNRKEAKQVKQQCEQIINTLDTSGVELSQSYAKAEVQIKEAFEKVS